MDERITHAEVPGGGVVGENADLVIRFTLSPENPALIQAYFIREVPKL